MDGGIMGLLSQLGALLLLDGSVASRVESLTVLGPVGVVLLLTANVLIMTRFSRYFPPVNGMACMVFFMHAWNIGDMSFMIVNAFITLAMTYKTYAVFVRKERLI